MSDGWDAAIYAAIGAVLALSLSSCDRNMDRWLANDECQKLGYSAGHFERKAGIVCEQWIEAAKLPKAK